MNQEYMKEKPVLPLVVSMGLPMTLSMLVNALYNIVDSYFVAKISEDAMTALSLVYPIQNIINSVGVGFGIGINAVIAIYLGAKKQEDADRAATMGVLLNFLHGILMMIGALIIMPAFLRLFTNSETVFSMGLEYSTRVFWLTIPLAVSVTFEKIFQSVGRMKVSMLCMMIGCIVNIILDPIMIFGIGPVPAMGIRGAAYATGIGQLASLAGYLTFCVVRPLPVRICLKNLHWDGALCRKIYSVGIPATLNMGLPSVQISALNGILAAYPGGYVLVLGAYYKLQTFLYLTANGVVQGMRPLIGYNYGAGEHKRVQQIFRTALVLIMSVMVLGTGLCMAIPGTLIGLFTENAETVRMGVQALRFISIGFIISSVSVTVSGALEGLGKGMPSLVISLLRYLVILLPIAFVLSWIIGPAGVWNAFWITEFLTAGVAFLLYRKEVLGRK